MKTKLNLCLLALVIGLAFLLQNCEDDDTIVQYKLTTDVTPALSGSVSPSSGTFDEGTEISLTATPASEYVFKNWSNGASGTENPLSVIMNSDKNITAVFEKKNYLLNIVIVGQGTVTEEIIQAKSAGDYPSGTIVKLTAVPSAEWEFVEWSGDSQGTQNPLQITIDKPTSLTAKFEYISPKTYVPDDKFEQVLIDLGYDVVLDDYVNTNNIDKIIELSIISKNIADLTGIEDFVGLTRLYCSNNQLTNLDVSVNNSLTELFCDSNQIVSLDLSNNTALTVLYCANNLLNSLNVSNSIALSSLHCEENQFTALDVSNNTALSELNCGENKLTTLDVSNNTELIFLDCKNNQLSSLDIYNNINLRTLNCSDNQLTSLDISNNNLLGIRPFWDIFVCTNNPLDCIQISEQQLTGIDPLIYFWIKDDSASYSLNCNLNTNKTYVPDDNFEQALINLGYDDVLDDYVNTNNIDKIIELNIISKNIADLTGIEDFVSLTVLYCDDNLLTSLDVSKNTKLKFFNCFNNQLTSLDVSDLIDLRVLGCSGNQLTSLDISDLIELRVLGCSDNQLTSLDISNNDFLGIQPALFSLLDCTNNQLDCIQVNEEQLANIGINPLIYSWVKDDAAIYSLDCSSN